MCEFVSISLLIFNFCQIKFFNTSHPVLSVFVYSFTTPFLSFSELLPSRMSLYAVMSFVAFYGKRINICFFISFFVFLLLLNYFSIHIPYFSMYLFIC